MYASLSFGTTVTKRDTFEPLQPELQDEEIKENVDTVVIKKKTWLQLKLYGKHWGVNNIQSIITHVNLCKEDKGEDSTNRK